MKIKTAILAGILIAALPVAVQAQDVEGYENYQVSCESSADCNNFDVNYDQQSETNDEISQRTRERRTRSSSSDKQKYVGITGGLAIPGDDQDVGIGGSILGGYRLTENLGGELELFDYFGGTDTDDLGYNIFGIAANASYKLAFNQSDSKSVYGVAGLGLGYGLTNATGDIADEAEDAGADTSASGLLLQGKAGVGYPITDSIDLLGQIRYFNIFLGELNDVDIDNQNAITFDLGATFNF
jgi:hypothetical protein